MAASSDIALLGPQRFRPTVAETLRELGVEGPIALITAGWQEREREVEELSEHVGVETVNLAIYERAEEVFRADPELHRALRRRQEHLQTLQDLYRIRLKHALAAARTLMRRAEPSEPLVRARQSAVRAVRTLDRAHLRDVRRAFDGFDARWRPTERPVPGEQRSRIERDLERCSAVAVAGGHVAVLYNRMRLFGLPELMASKPIVAWSAGAMVASSRILLFHDTPPQGPGNAELLGPGFDLAPGLLPLPHASRRLRLDDPIRVAMLARRFSPLRCVALDDGSGVVLSDGRLNPRSGTRRLARTGRVSGMAVA